MLYRIYRFFINESGYESKEMWLATNNKAEAEEIVRRMNAIAEFNGDDTFTMEEGEEDNLSFVTRAEQYALDMAQGNIERSTYYIAQYQKEISVIKTVKALFGNATKAPKDMVPEMIEAIKGTDYGLFVCEYFHAHKLIYHYADGSQKLVTGENYARGSYLGIEDMQWHYENKWDFDDDLARIDAAIADEQSEIDKAKAFLEKMKGDGNA